MADEPTDFSLHEMEEMKRRMAESHAPGTAASGAQAPGAAPGESGDAGAPLPAVSAVAAGRSTAPPGAAAGGQGDDPPPQATFSQHAVEGDLESLQIRRALRVIRRHWIAIALITLFVPGVVAFTDIYVRDKVYSASAVYERLDEAELSTLRIGMMTISARQSETDDVRRMLGSNEVQEHLQKLVLRRAEELEAELPDLSDPKKRAARRELVRTLRRMHEDDAVFRSRSGAISARDTSQSLVRVTVTGVNERVHVAIANLVGDALNAYARRHREEQVTAYRQQLNELWTENQAQLESVRQAIAEKNARIEEMDADVSERFSVAQRLEGVLFEQRMQANEQRLELRHLRREIDWTSLARKLGVEDEQDIDAVLVKGNPLREKWRELARLRAELEAKYLPEHPRLKEVTRSIMALRAQLKDQGSVTSAGAVPPLPTEQEEAQLLKIRRKMGEVRLAESRVEETTEALRRARAEESMTASGESLTEEEARRLRKLRDERDALVEQQRKDKAKSLQIYSWRNEARMLENQVEKERKFEIHSKAHRAVLESPRLELDVALGLALGLLLGCAAAFLLESVDNRLHTPFDVYYHLRLNYLGVIPFWSDRESLVISAEKPDSHIAEIYAHLRNNIRYGRAGHPEKCLLIASATQGEGKSTAAANLAVSYALEGNSVVLIDADLRRPRGHRLLEIFQEGRRIEQGLSDFLTGDAALGDILYPTTTPGLTLVPAGSRVRNPAKLMGSPDMRNFIKQAEQEFEIVIIDCPAVLPVVDATTLSGYVRGVLMVIAAEEVEIGAVRMALYRLQHVGSPIVGAVLNKVRERSTSYYYYGYRYRSGYHYSPYVEPYGADEEEPDAAG